VAAGSTVRQVSGEVVGLGTVERRLLAKMPLHAISSRYGEAGLRERLLVEAARFPGADPRTEKALARASRLHAQDLVPGGTRKDAFAALTWRSAGAQPTLSLPSAALPSGARCARVAGQPVQWR
jgi:hypothetical protein